MGRHKKVRPDGNGLRAVFYVRVSKEDGETKHGMEVQRADIDRYALGKGYIHVASFHDDGVSGATPLEKRQGLSEAFALCLAGQADVIVAYNQDRFARSMGVWEAIRNKAIGKNIRLETAEGRVLTDDKDQLMGEVMAFAAAMERRRISERFMAARAYRSQKDGRGSAPLPFGYVALDEGGIGVDATAAAAICLLLACRAQGMTYQATANALNAGGHHSPRGGSWKVGLVLAVEQRADLYRTGRRIWRGIESAQVWPIIAA